ncbi:hypothetical protein [Methylobacterium sp. P5_C11]
MSDDNVIRPAFGVPRTPAPDPEPDLVQAPLSVVGTGAGHRVGLIRDPSAAEGDVIRIVVGPEGEPGVETVALLPAEAEAEAERIGFAILRALEVVEGAV